MPAIRPIAVPPIQAPILSLRTCVIVSTLFWTYVSVTAVARTYLVRDALHWNGEPPLGVLLLTSALIYPALLVAVSVSWRVGYDFSNWRRIVPTHLVLAVAFGALARPIYIFARIVAGLDPAVGAYPGLFGPDSKAAFQMWLSMLLDDGMQYLVLQGLLAAFSHYGRLRLEQNQRERVSAQYDRARLQALRMQTNPHFLFNTLSAIAGLIHSRPTAASNMVTRLGELLRTTLTDSDVELVPLHREVTLGREYLELQRERFQDRLQYSLDLPAQARNAGIPPLLLQPLLENAVEHGIHQREGFINVELTCACTGDTISIRICNQVQQPESTDRARHTGLGLQIVRERLDAAFGKSAAVTTGRTHSGWFEASLTFPHHAIRKRSNQWEAPQAR
ncbi:MAG: histidine kinase [Steroidobacteraceae bacterium]